MFRSFLILYICNKSLVVDNRIRVRLTSGGGSGGNTTNMSEKKRKSKSFFSSLASSLTSGSDGGGGGGGTTNPAKREASRGDGGEINAKVTSASAGAPKPWWQKEQHQERGAGEGHDHGNNGIIHAGSEEKSGSNLQEQAKVQQSIVSHPLLPQEEQEEDAKEARVVLSEEESPREKVSSSSSEKEKKKNKTQRRSEIDGMGSALSTSTKRSSKRMSKTFGGGSGGDDDVTAIPMDRLDKEESSDDAVAGVGAKAEVEASGESDTEEENGEEKNAGSSVGAWIDDKYAGPCKTFFFFWAAAAFTLFVLMYASGAGWIPQTTTGASGGDNPQETIIPMATHPVADMCIVIEKSAIINEMYGEANAQFSDGEPGKDRWDLGGGGGGGGEGGGGTSERTRFDLRRITNSMLYHMKQNNYSGICAMDIGEPLCYCMMYQPESKRAIPLFNLNITGHKESVSLHKEGSHFCGDDYTRFVRRFNRVRVEYLSVDLDHIQRVFEFTDAFIVQQLADVSVGITSCNMHQYFLPDTKAYQDDLYSTPQLPSAPSL